MCSIIGICSDVQLLVAAWSDLTDSVQQPTKFAGGSPLRCRFGYESTDVSGVLVKDLQLCGVWQL